MKKSIFLFLALISQFVMSQTQFEFSENGLTPKFLYIQLDGKSAAEINESAKKWFIANSKNFNLDVVKSEENKIEFTTTKNNGTNLDKQYFHIKYEIELRFEENNLKFIPKSIQLKLNSKYDMGWKDFDLSEGYTFYKRGKLVRKYRDYISSIMLEMNRVYDDIRLGIN